MAIKSTKRRFSGHLGSAVHRMIHGVPIGILAMAASGPAVAQQDLWEFQGGGARVHRSLDLDQDAVLDVIVLEVEYDRGEVWLVSGRDGTEISTARDGTPWRLGLVSDVVTLGDVNGDGVHELVVGNAAANDRQGCVVVLSGLDASNLYTVNGGANDHLGTSVLNAGDLDGDGVEDFLVGATEFHERQPGEGYVAAYSGIDGSPIYEIRGSSPGEEYGTRLEALDDWDQDSVNEFVVTARFARDVLSGQTGARVVRLSGGGLGIRNAGDVNRDGFDDLVSGLARFDHGGLQDTGYYAIHAGPNGSILHEEYGQAAGELLGGSVGPAGDFDGDGFADVVVTRQASFEVPFFPSASFVRVISGRTMRILYEFQNSEEDDFGISSDTLGDVNGDGRSEIVVASPAWNAFTGRVQAFQGDDLFCNSIPKVLEEGDLHILDVGEGRSGDLAVLFIVAVNGNPFLVRLLLGFMDADGHLKLQATIPPGLSGLEITFFGAALVNGAARAADPETVLYR